MRYKLAIFDMDGTILNTIDDLAASLNYVLEKSGFPARTMDEVISFIGDGLRKLIERGVPEGTDSETVDKVLADFKEYYAVHCADKTAPYDGIIGLLENLRRNGCLTAVVSNKADDAVQELCRKYFDGLFDYAVGERSGILRKPAPDSVNEVLEKLNVSRGNAVYIGDSDVVPTLNYLIGDFHYLFTCLRVKGGCMLIKQQKLWLYQCTHKQGYNLSLTARKKSDFGFHSVFKSHSHF